MADRARLGWRANLDRALGVEPTATLDDTIAELRALAAVAGVHEVPA